MGDIIELNNSENDSGQQNNELTEIADALLVDVRNGEIPKDKSVSMPIAMLTSLGAGVSSLIPAFNTVTQTTAVDMTGYYQIINMGVGDKLKPRKAGGYWASFVKPEGKSVFAQLKEADPATATNKIVMNANPATMMMAVALCAIEKELVHIADMQKQIISFLEIEKEAEIEADVELLGDIISKYKHNWDNERYVASNHKLVCDIQRTARKNMIASQKAVSEALEEKHFLMAGNKVNSMLNDLIKKFKYYRLSLYSFALASLIEMMLSGNFKQENIRATVDEIDKQSTNYRELFGKCSLYVEKISGRAVELQILKGVGTASGAVGKLIGSIPKVKNGQVDEFLIDKGQKIKDNADGVSKEMIASFATVSDPNTGTLMQKMRDMDRIYNQTEMICFDRENLYLIAG